MAEQIRWSEKILPAFRDFWMANRDDDYLYHVLKGGRNSSKSSHISVVLIREIMQYPVNGLVVRKVGNTLADSVVEQLRWAIDYLGVDRYFSVRQSPPRLTYLPRGNSIIFRGADKPEKIKSIKSSKFPIARLWIEELAEFGSEDEVMTIVNSVLRADLGDLKYKIYFSYNPPKRKQNWVNKRFETHFLPKNTFVHHSTLLDNPYNSKEVKEEAENVRKRNPLKYRWMYLGEPIGSGIVPFDNLTFRTITDEEIATFDNIRQGIDWGYGTDAFSFVRWHYDKTRHRLYCMDELYGVKLSNEYVAGELKNRGYDRFQTIADSAEPKSVDEFKLKYHFKIKGARKGPGSVEYGEKWLDELEEIIIDADRTPHTAKEWEDIDYQTDKDGNIKNRLEDAANHSIDGTRYAMEDDMRYGKSHVIPLGDSPNRAKAQVVVPDAEGNPTTGKDVIDVETIPGGMLPKPKLRQEKRKVPRCEECGQEYTKRRGNSYFCPEHGWIGNVGLPDPPRG